MAHPMQLEWSICSDPMELVEILSLVEPYPREFQAIMACLKLTPSVYKAFVAKRVVEPKCDSRALAIVIATYLPHTQTVHIEDYALHPIIRGLGLAQSLWHTWRRFVELHEGWAWDQAITIEVYNQNVKVWGKIMGVEAIDLTSTETPARLPLAPEVPIVFMGRDLVASPAVIYAEWIAVQKREQNLLPVSSLLGIHTKQPRSNL